VGPQKVADTCIGYFYLNPPMTIVYILYSRKISRFYSGITSLSVVERVHQHLEKHYPNKFTGHADDWEVFLTIECGSLKQARSLERHIKRMKSSIYIRNLKKYPEMVEKIRNRFASF